MTQISNTTSAAKTGLESTDAQNQLGSFSRSQAMIEFNLDGTILTANDNFCKALGYSIEELKGQHHRMFCDPEYTRSQEYANFWADLSRGQFSTGEFK